MTHAWRQWKQRIFKGLDRVRKKWRVSCMEPVQAKQNPYSETVSPTAISFKFYLSSIASERPPFENLKYPSYSHSNIPFTYIFFIALCIWNSLIVRCMSYFQNLTIKYKVHDILRRVLLQVLEQHLGYNKNRNTYY